MPSCPSCQAELRDADVRSGKCPACGRTLPAEQTDDTEPSEPGKKPAGGGSPVDSAAFDTVEMDTLSETPAPEEKPRSDAMDSSAFQTFTPGQTGAGDAKDSSAFDTQQVEPPSEKQPGPTDSAAFQTLPPGTGESATGGDADASAKDSAAFQTFVPGDPAAGEPETQQDENEAPSALDSSAFETFTPQQPTDESGAGRDTSPTDSSAFETFVAGQGKPADGAEGGSPTDSSAFQTIEPGSPEQPGSGAMDSSAFQTFAPDAESGEGTATDSSAFQSFAPDEARDSEEPGPADSAAFQSYAAEGPSEDSDGGTPPASGEAPGHADSAAFKTLEPESAAPGPPDTWPEDSLTQVGADESSQEAMQTIKAVWEGHVDPKTKPQMTIKAEALSQPAKTNLVIRSRSLLETGKGDPSLADYEITSVLGEGGMGTVFLARQTAIDRTVALKMIKTKAAQDEEQKQKFLSEAVVTGDLNHPNIVPIYDLGSNEKGALFYSMKQVEGTPWMDVIGEKSLSENIETLMKVADAVAFAHSRGVVHRDLKPENVMLGEFGEVLLMDWGLALPTSDFRKVGSVAQSSGMGGTPAYMAPEMASGPIDRIGPHSDIYLLGAILYEIVTGRPPRMAKSAMQCLFSAIKNTIEPPGQSGELIDIAMRAMSTDPEDRQPSVQEFQDQIRDYQSHSESISLSTRAQEDLDEARQTNDYQRFSQALFGFEEAYSLWNGNDKAREGIRETKRAYAESALQKGDFDLGIGLLDQKEPAFDELRTRLRAAQEERDARQHRLRRTKQIVTGLAAAIFLIVSGSAVAIYQQYQEAERQRTIAQENAEEAREQTILAQENAEEAEQQRKEAVAAQEEAEDQRERAEENAEEARKQQMLAQQSAEEARQQQMRAEENAKIAQENADEARRQQNIAEYEAYIAQIGLASAKIDENAFDTARQLLRECNPEHRNWEWGRLMHLCNQGTAVYPAGSKVDAVDIAPEGKRFVVGTQGGEAHLCELRRRGDDVQITPVRNLLHSGLVQAAVFSPDGRLIATGSSNGTAKLWDAETGEEVATLIGHDDEVLSVAFSPQGHRLLTGSYDGTARLWDVKSGRQTAVLEGHYGAVWDASFSPDGTKIVTAGADQTALVWTETSRNWTEAGGITHGPYFRGHTGAVYAAEFSPDSKYVISGGYDKRVLVWNTDRVHGTDYEERVDVSLDASEFAPQQAYRYTVLEGHTGAVRTVGFHRTSDDRLIAFSGGHDNVIRYWRLRTHARLESRADPQTGVESRERVEELSGELLKTFRGHDSWVRDCAVSPDGRWILSGSHDARARIWTIDRYEEEREFQNRLFKGRILEGHTDAVLDASFSPAWESLRQIVTASRDRTARTWDFRTGAMSQEFAEGHTLPVSSAVFFDRAPHRGKRFVTAGLDNTARIWDVASGTELQRLDGTGRSAALALSHDEQWVLTGSDHETARLWNAETGELIREFAGHNFEVSAVAFSPDDTRVLTGTTNGRCRLFETATGKLVREFDKVHTAAVIDAVFLPEGDRLLTASRDNTVAQWNVQTGEDIPARTLKHNFSAVNALAVSDDGRRALTAAADGYVRLWDVANAEEIGQIDPAGRVVTSVDITSDGRFGLTVAPEIIDREDREKGQDPVVQLWDLETLQEVEFSPGKRGLPVQSAAFSPEGHVLTLIRNSARLWDRRTGTERMNFEPHDVVAAAGYSPDGRYIVTGSWDNSARVWDAETGHAVLKLGGTVNSEAKGDSQAAHAAQINSAVFSPVAGVDEKGEFSLSQGRILTAGDDGTAKLWSLAGDSGEVLRTFSHRDDKGTGESQSIHSAVFSPDGKFVLTASADRTARIWNAETGEPVQLFRGHAAPLLAAEFSADGNRVMTGSEDTTARIWDVETGEALLEFEGHTAAVTDVAFSPDGQRVLTAAEDNTAKLWDAQPSRQTEQTDAEAENGEAENQAAEDGDDRLTVGQELLTLHGHTQEVTSVDFSPDGQYALTASQDGRAILWLAVDWQDGPAVAPAAPQVAARP